MEQESVLQKPIEVKYSIRRVDTPNGRAYYADGQEGKDREYFYSSTTIIDGALAKGIGFDMWLGNSNSYADAMEYASEKADRGTCVHEIVERMILGDTIDTQKGWYNERSESEIKIDDGIKGMLDAYIKFNKEFNPEVLSTELSLYNPKKYKNRFGEGPRFPFAGTADLICRTNQKNTDGQQGDSKLSIIDIKTGKEYHHSHELQLTSYKLLFDSLYEKDYGCVDDMYCLYLRPSGNYKLVQYTFQPDLWYLAVDMFHYLISSKTGRMPKIKEKQPTPRFYTLDGPIDEEIDNE